MRSFFFAFVFSNLFLKSAIAAVAGFSSQLMNPGCFHPSHYSQVEDDLKSYKITINNAKDPSHSLYPHHKVLIPGVLKRATDLGLHKNIVSHITINVYPGGKPSGATCSSNVPNANTINLVVNCYRHDDPRRTLAHFSHELGHIVGNRGYYKAYKQNLPQRCAITDYSTNNTNKSPRNEEFAEVFAIYLHSPDHLKAACPQHYEWMRQHVFNGGPDPFTGPSVACSGNPNIPKLGPQVDMPIANNNTLGQQTASLQSALQNILPMARPALTMPVSGGSIGGGIPALPDFGGAVREVGGGGGYSMPPTQTSANPPIPVWPKGVRPWPNMNRQDLFPQIQVPSNDRRLLPVPIPPAGTVPATSHVPGQPLPPANQQPPGQPLPPAIGQPVKNQ